MALICCLDTETTGVKPTEDRICEIALVLWDTVTGKERMAFEKRINPQMHIAPGAVKVHGITDADVMGCPDFSTIAPSLANLLGKVDAIVGHNAARFDMVLLVHEMLRVGVTPPELPPVIDTMLDGRWATSDGKIPTLGELCWALDVPYDSDQAHAALYDVRCNLAAYIKAVELGIWEHPEVRQKALAA